MRNLSGPKGGMLVVLAATVALFAAPVRGHVLLLNPNGGEQIEVCSQFTVRWQIQIFHALLNWDLWYSKTGPTGPWTTIAMNLPAGSSAVGSVHTYNWTIPPDVDASVWVRVRMDNTDRVDYYDVNNGSFSIDPVPTDVNADYSVDVLDLIDLLLCFGQPANPPCNAADIDDSGMVDRLDLIELLLDFGDSCP